MRVISLFDWISIGRYALQQAKVPTIQELRDKELSEIASK